MEINDSFKGEQLPPSREILNPANLPYIEKAEVRKLLQSPLQLPEYNKGLNLGIGLPSFDSQMDDTPESIVVTSFGEGTEIKPRAPLTGIVILRDIYRISDSEIDGENAVVITVDPDGKGLQLFPLLITLKNLVNISGLQDLGLQVDNSVPVTEIGHRQWVLTENTYKLTQTSFFDIATIHKKKGRYSYIAQSTPSRDFGKSHNPLTLLNNQMNKRLGFSYDPIRDHHFCDYMPGDNPVQVFNFATYANGIPITEALWVPKPL